MFLFGFESLFEIVVFLVSIDLFEIDLFETDIFNPVSLDKFISLPPALDMVMCSF